MSESGDGGGATQEARRRAARQIDDEMREQGCQCPCAGPPKYRDSLGLNPIALQSAVGLEVCLRPWRTGWCMWGQRRAPPCISGWTGKERFPNLERAESIRVLANDVRGGPSSLSWHLLLPGLLQHLARVRVYE